MTNFKLVRESDPTIPEMKSKTWALYKDNELLFYISQNFKEDEELNIEIDEIVLWTPKDGVFSEIKI